MLIHTIENSLTKRCMGGITLLLMNSFKLILKLLKLEKCNFQIWKSMDLNLMQLVGKVILYFRNYFNRCCFSITNKDAGYSQNKY